MVFICPVSQSVSFHLAVFVPIPVKKKGIELHSLKNTLVLLPWLFRKKQKQRRERAPVYRPSCEG